jgi:hypothetical protein
MKITLFASVFGGAAALGNYGPGAYTAQTTKYYSDELCTELTQALTKKVKQCTVISATQSTYISNTTTPGTQDPNHFSYVTQTWNNAACSGAAATSTTQQIGECAQVVGSLVSWQQMNVYTETLQTMIAAAYTDNTCQTQTTAPQYLHTENALGTCDGIWNSGVANAGFKVSYHSTHHFAKIEMFNNIQCAGTSSYIEANVDVCTPVKDATFATALGCATADACWVNVFPQGPMTASGATGIGGIATIVVAAAAAAALIIA